MMSKTDKRNRIQSLTQRLIDEDVYFTVHNNGAHLVLHDGDLLVDFWPGTERWRPRDDAQSRFGIDNLINYLKPDSVLCPVCDGTGEGPASNTTCSFCRGRGEVEPWRL